MKPKHQLGFRVRSYEVDTRGRLQVPILCRLLQEAATAHAIELGVSVEQLAERGVAWVLTHLRLTAARWPGADDDIVITTWPEAANRLHIERRFVVTDTPGRPILEAATLWLVMDLASRRPVRLPAGITDAMSKYDIGAQPLRPDRWSSMDRFDREVAFTVRRSDLDLAGHVNNTSYVEWAIEAVPDELWAACELTRLEIDYVAECHRGHTVASLSQVSETTDGVETLHRLVRRDDDKTVARARTRWRRSAV